MKSRIKIGLQPICMSIALFCLAGCVMGPDFERPVVATSEQFTTDPVTAVTLVEETTLPSQWWELFGSAELNKLIERALLSSPTLAQSQARLAEANEIYRAYSGETRYPAVDAFLEGKRQQIDPATMGLKGIPKPGPFTLYGAGLQISYTFDLFGAIQRELEFLQAGVDLQRYELEGAHLMLAGNIAKTAIRQAAIRAQLDAVAVMLDVQQRQLDMLMKRCELGGVSALEVDKQRLRVADIRASAASLQEQLANTLYLLAVYAGDEPSTAALLPVFKLNELEKPEVLPIVLPSDLIKQRPDIRASEALLQQASAQVGIATANLFPHLTLGASASFADLKAGDLLGGGVDVWSLGGGLLQPLFHGGALRARKRGAEAAYKGALSAYQETVLQGLRDVADALQALEQGTQVLIVRREQTATVGNMHQIIAGQYESGGVSEATLLEARNEFWLTVSIQAEAEAVSLTNVVVLMQALGGGWDTVRE